MNTTHQEARIRTPLHVGIIAMVQPGTVGGVEQAIYGTVAALGKLRDGDERYTVVVEPTAAPWLDTARGENVKIVMYPRSRLYRYARRVLRSGSPTVENAYRLAVAMRSKIGPAALQTATYDPFLESQGVRVMHFPYQWYCATSMPSIFNPQDVQQFYHPEFFSKAEMRFRTSHYQKWCDACTLIDVPSAATKQDLIRFMGIAPGKVAVVPKASPLVFVASGIADLNATRKALHLPAQFMLFPAQTWPHKNHARLFEALAQLRDRENLRLHLVCTGRRNEHWSHLAAKVRELDLSSQVQFLDYVPAAQLKALYHLAEFTVFPTLFEGGGLPLLEAFCEGSPLACSAIPVLVEQTGDAALLFDPLSVEGIAAALRQLHADPQLRATLRERGLVVAQHYTWERTARTYRALYRKLGSSPLTDEDHALIRTAMT